LGSRRDQSGAAALEFGLIAGFIFIPLVLGIMQYGWYFYVAQTTGGAASHVARRLAVGDCWGSNEALTFVQNEVGSNPANTALVMEPTSNTDAEIGIDQVEVTVTSEANVLGFWPMPNDGTITRTVKTMIEDTTSSGAC
jgi:Flp pilus assembly protein TadG